MTVNKITSPITPLELIDKTNEIIDNLGGGGTAPVWGNITGTLADQTDLQNALDGKVTLATTQTITADKTTTGITYFQNGSGSGCITLGADAGATTLTANTRKIGRMNFHTQDLNTNCAFVSTDSQDSVNYVEFGGRTGDQTNTAPDVLRFTLATVHNSKSSSNKFYPLTIDKTNANFTVQPKYNNVNLATVNDIPTDTSDLTNGAGFITSSALNGYATETWVGQQGFLTSVPTATTSSLGLVQPDGTTVTINNGVISASASAPSNMVTTNTAQDVTAKKTFKSDIQQNGSNFLIYDSSSTPNYAGRISSTAGNRRNITISGGGNYGSEVGSLKIGYEGTGTYYDMQGLFVGSTPSTSSTYTSEVGIKLGSINSRASISGNGGQVKITANALYPQKNYLKVANDSLTYIDNSGTSHDLLAVSTPSYDSTNERITW